jgi:predicted ATPase/signal transduction histidine kinase/GAF domain-containing protein
MKETAAMPNDRRFSGYTITQPVGEAADFALHRALRHEDQSRVLLKVPVARHPSPAILRRLEHEYEVARELDPSTTLRPLALERQAGDMALVLEDCVCQSLADMVGTPMEAGRFLKIAIAVCVAVAALHRHGFIHKDIKPANLFVDAAGQARLSGLGLASRLPRERQRPDPPALIAGTLAYMAPEQTGRMSRSVDARSDLYSVGVTFYEMLTGGLPFTAADPMEWIHCHIARQVVAPIERNTAIPEPLSAIVMKLLAKTAEERYQTASGLVLDLRLCLAEWESSGRIAPFILGAHDTPDRLLIPEKLYGREGEIAALVGAFDRVVARGSTELVLVSGYSGIGKSSVVGELHKVLVPPRGLFGAGKFDQLKRDIPYSTLGQAFHAIIRHILAQSDPEVARWRDDLGRALEPDGRLMTDLVPELGYLIGPQPPVPSLPPQDARNRFHAVFRRFLGVFARPEHPLTLFLDDLQWLDGATLALLDRLLTEPEAGPLLLVGAYRDNEVDSTHPLARTLETIRKVAADRVHEIKLAPLDVGDLARLIADAIRCDEPHVWPLARLVHEKTGGNPFFATQFLATLADERLLAFDPAAMRWTWDVERIQAKAYTDNVVELMAGKLSGLPEETRRALEPFACLGNSAEVGTLALVHEMPEDALHAALWPAVCAGLVVRLDHEYRFLHDRVQEAAYSLIPEKARASEHLRIGRLLASRTDPAGLEENIFEIVNQLDRAVPLMTSPEEREQVARFNLLAGERAKKATAYQSALRYLSIGRGLLADDCWTYLYELAFSLELNRAECEFLTANLAKAEENLTALSHRAANLADRARVACLRMDIYMTLDRSDRAVEVCLEYLRGIGIDWSPHPAEGRVWQEYEGIWERLGNRSIESLANLPELSDPNWRATMDVLTAGLVPAYFTDGNLRDLSICRMVNISLEHGNSDASSVGYVHLGLVLGPKFGDYDAAFRFGKLALDMVEGRGLDRFKARVYVCFGGLIAHWKRPLRECREFLRVAFDVATRTGDITFAMYGIRFLSVNQLASGDPLSDTQRATENALRFARKVRFGTYIDMITVERQLIRMLRGCVPAFSSLNDTEFDESAFEGHPRLALGATFYWLCKMQARFHGAEYMSALDALLKADGDIWVLTSLINTAEYHFWGALTRAACHALAPVDGKAALMHALATHEKQLKLWAENCPENFGSCAALVAAEIARIEARDGDAMRLYGKAVRLARESGFVNHEAIANERAALFFQERESEAAAHAHMQEAVHCYARWGADGKVRHLQERHPCLRAGGKRRGAPTTIAAAQEQFDLLTVVKAQQAISSEIVMDRLGEALLRIALENAGARRGLLFVEPDIELLAVASTQQGNTPVEFRRESFSPGVDFSASVINYVKRTGEPVILDDAAADAGDFARDEYVMRAKPRSVLCMPIMRQAKLNGILYLENDAVAGAFTADRRAVLEMLASQAAISLETAKLYADLQRSQDDLQGRTLILRSILDSIGEGVVVVDEHGEFLVYNPAAEAIIGPGVAGGPGRWTPHFRFYLPDQVTPYPAADLPLAKAVRGESVDGEELFARPAGRPEGVWLSVTARPLAGPAGAVSGGVAVFSDITGRKRAEHEIRTLNTELEQRVTDRTLKLEVANQELESFSYSVSHDLRAPLRSIDGFSRILEEDFADKLDDQGRGCLQKIRTSSEHMRQLIDDMLQLSRVTRTELRRSPVDLSLLARAVVEGLRVAEPQRSVELVVEPGLIVHADEHLMRIVLENLIGNAWKYTGRRPAARIEFGRVPREGEPAYFVRDNGAGFDAQFAHKLFQAFQRLHPVSEFPGTGIGLATVQRVIHRHGGRVWAEGERGRGATFFFTLPDGGGSGRAENNIGS